MVQLKNPELCSMPVILGKNRISTLKNLTNLYFIFQVIFYVFYARPTGSFKSVTSNLEGNIDVHVTQPLSLLNVEDRMEIAKVLLAMKGKPAL